MTTTTRTARPSGRQETLAPPVRRTYAILVGLTALSVLVQAVTAGLFVDQEGKSADSWTAANGLLAMVLSVRAMVLSVRSATLRKVADTVGV